MARFTYRTQGVCSRSIDIEIEDGVIIDVTYHGGCSGNTQGIGALVRGMRAEDAAERLAGIRCGFKPTSCPDQLSRALREYLDTL